MYQVELFRSDAKTIKELSSRWMVDPSDIVRAIIIEEIFAHINRRPDGSLEKLQTVKNEEDRTAWEINMPIRIEPELGLMANLHEGTVNQMLGDLVHKSLKNNNYDQEPGGPMTDALGDNYISSVWCEKILNGWIPEGDYKISALLYALLPGKANPHNVVLKFDDKEMLRLSKAARQEGRSAADYLTNILQVELSFLWDDDDDDEEEDY